jgi:hypothetical protein
MPFTECSFAACREPVAFEAIGTYDEASDLYETVVLVLCERHADAFRDELVILELA